MIPFDGYPCVYVVESAEDSSVVVDLSGGDRRTVLGEDIVASSTGSDVYLSWLMDVTI